MHSDGKKPDSARPVRDVRLALEVIVLALIAVGLMTLFAMTYRLDAAVLRYALLGPPDVDEASRISAALAAMDSLDPGAARGIVATLDVGALEDPHLRPILLDLHADLGSLGRPELPLLLDEWYASTTAPSPAGAAAVGRLYVFWEVWCPHCRLEIPRLARLARSASPGRIEIVGVTRMSRHVRAEELESFLREQTVDFPTGRDRDGAMFEYYKIDAVPTSVLIKGGVVAWRGNAERVTADRLEQWLAP